MAPDSAPASFVPGIIRVEGADAAEFLRAQLTNDVARLGADRNFLAAWCDAKGRTQLVTRIVALADGAYLLVVPAELIEAIVKRLTMYVLRAKVTLRDVSEHYALTGRLGAPDAPSTNETRVRGEQLAVGLAPALDDLARTLVITPRPDRDEDGLRLDSDRWQRATIDAGVPQISAATQGEFVPQMLNLHWLMAIDFAKGCYPGQEIIARLHYRGRLTRRLFRLSFEGQTPQAGSVLKTADGTTAGTVIHAIEAELEDGELGVMLAVVATEFAGQSLRTTHQGIVSLLDLPYPTPD